MTSGGGKYHMNKQEEESRKAEEANEKIGVPEGTTFAICATSHPPRNTLFSPI